LKKLHGGARMGAGRKAGGKNAATIEREEKRELVRQMVDAELRPIIRALIKKAVGVSHVVGRHKSSGKFQELKDIDQIVASLNGDGDFERAEIWTRDPDTQSAVHLLDRLLDRVQNQPQEVDVQAEVTLKWED
jgi:hypothetical protein